MRPIMMPSLAAWSGKKHGMSGMAKSSDEKYSEKEAAARRDEVIKRMISMPPKPHSE
jgi:hypothetical protein